MGRIWVFTHTQRWKSRSNFRADLNLAGTRIESLLYAPEDI